MFSMAELPRLFRKEFYAECATNGVCNLCTRRVHGVSACGAHWRDKHSTALAALFAKHPPTNRSDLTYHINVEQLTTCRELNKARGKRDGAFDSLAAATTSAATPQMVNSPLMRFKRVYSCSRAQSLRRLLTLHVHIFFTLSSAKKRSKRLQTRLYKCSSMFLFSVLSFPNAKTRISL